MWRLITAWLDEIRRAAGLKLPPIADRRKYAKPRRYGTRPRRWEDVDTITLHQTACNMGERISRYDGTGAHRIITQLGRRIWLHDPDVRVVHAQALNNRAIGIEVDGQYPGVEGDLSTLWDNPDTPKREQPTTLTEAAVVALHLEVRYLVELVEQHGGRIRYITAHRQASKSRRADPGGEIWRRGALPLMAELGLSDGGVGYEVGGYPIPEAWDPRCEGIRY